MRCSASPSAPPAPTRRRTTPYSQRSQYVPASAAVEAGPARSRLRTSALLTSDASAVGPSTCCTNAQYVSINALPRLTTLAGLPGDFCSHARRHLRRLSPVKPRRAGHAPLRPSAQSPSPTNNKHHARSRVYPLSLLDTLESTLDVLLEHVRGLRQVLLHVGLSGAAVSGAAVSGAAVSGASVEGCSRWRYRRMCAIVSVEQLQRFLCGLLLVQHLEDVRQSRVRACPARTCANQLHRRRQASRTQCWAAPSSTTSPTCTARMACQCVHSSGRALGDERYGEGAGGLVHLRCHSGSANCIHRPRHKTFR